MPSPSSADKSSSKTARARRAARRHREPSLARAVVLGLLTTLGVGVLAFEWQLNTPGTPLSNLYRLLVVNGQVSPGSGLIQQLLGEIRWQDVAFVSFAAQAAGGLVLGRAAPAGAGRRRVVGAAAAAALASVVAWATATWGAQAAIQGGHLDTRELSTAFLMRQTLWSLLWAAAFVLGTLAGLALRGRRQP